MRRALHACLAAGLLLPVLAGSAGAVDQAAGQERLGARFGYVEGFGDLHASHGNGWDMTLHFTERVKHPLFLEVRIGAIYMGDLKYTELDDQITNVVGLVSAMRILYFGAGPLAGFQVGESQSLYGSAGIGIYSVSITLDSAFSAFDLSDQSLGFNGAVGLVRRLSDNWSIEANATLHYFFTSQNEAYKLFTANAEDPFLLGIAAGLAVDLR